MLIGYDGRFITKTPTGNGVYATRLIESLSALDERNCYRVYMAGPDPAVPPGLGTKVTIRTMHPWHRSAWFRVPISFPWELSRRPVDVFHAHYTIPPWIRAKTVLTLHDFFGIVYPELFVSLKRFPSTFMMKRSIVRADRILVGATFIKQETMDYFHVPEERFAVIPYGLDLRFLAPVTETQLAEARARYGIEGPYILAVGDIHPRKNLARLIQAFTLLPQRHEIKLVLVGKPLWKTQELFDQISKARLERNVIATGYVADADMPLLYGGAEVFCYPSLYEGFGFPVIEAMASGVPVAASNASSIPETGGTAAVYFQPTEVESIADALARLLADSQLRADHVAAGRQWARRFTWDETARRTLEVYRSLE